MARQKEAERKNSLKNLENFELHHRILFFLAILILTILITRGIIYYVIDPNPTVMGVELHHFDYGLALLTIVCLLMLFEENWKKHFALYLILTAISLGLIIDELWFIQKQIGGNNPTIYNPSLIYALITAILLSLIALLISHYSRKKLKN